VERGGATAMASEVAYDPKVREKDATSPAPGRTES
jgi:hypothetical protein